MVQKTKDMNPRNQMNEAIREIVIPFLRDKGFSGSFPHFRRHSNNKIDLITF